MSEDRRTNQHVGIPDPQRQVPPKPDHKHDCGTRFRPGPPSYTSSATCENAAKFPNVKASVNRLFVLLDKYRSALRERWYAEGDDEVFDADYSLDGWRRRFEAVRRELVETTRQEHEALALADAVRRELRWAYPQPLFLSDLWQRWQQSPDAKLYPDVTRRRLREAADRHGRKLGMFDRGDSRRGCPEMEPMFRWATPQEAVLADWHETRTLEIPDEW